MKRTTWLAACCLIAASAPLPAAAQFGSLMNMIPGTHAVPGAAVDPDRFLADTLETTKLMMISAALLAQAAANKDELASQASYVQSIQNIQDCKELESHKAEFQKNIAAISANDESTASIERAYAQGNEEQKKLIAAASFNLMLGIYRNVRLGQEASQLVSNLKSNPMMLMKAPRLMAAANLIFMEVKATAAISGSMSKLMSAMKVSAPAQSETTKPLPVAL